MMNKKEQIEMCKKCEEKSNDFIGFSNAVGSIWEAMFPGVPSMFVIDCPSLLAHPALIGKAKMSERSELVVKLRKAAASLMDLADVMDTTEPHETVN